ALELLGDLGVYHVAPAHRELHVPLLVHHRGCARRERRRRLGRLGRLRARRRRERQRSQRQERRALHWRTPLLPAGIRPSRLENAIVAPPSVVSKRRPTL